MDISYGSNALDAYLQQVNKRVSYWRKKVQNCRGCCEWWLGLDVGSDNDLVVIAKVLDTDVDEVMDVLSYYFSELSLLRIGERLSMSREKVRIIIRTTIYRNV